MNKIMRRNGIHSPYANKKTKKAMKKQEDKIKLEIDNDVIFLKDTPYIIYDENPHPTYYKNLKPGEIIQMDTGFFVYNDIKYAFHIAVDYATKTIVGGYFDKEETTLGYFYVLKQIIMECLK